MTNNFEKNFKNLMQESKKTVLLAEEKDGIRSKLLYFVKENPEIIESKHLPAKARFQNIIGFLNAKATKRYVSLAVIFFVLCSISASVAANNSLPGDLLYPIKTRVNEKVLALTLFSNQAKAEYEINLAQLRLQEAETIALQNKLTSQSTQEVRTLLSNHLNDIQTRIINIKNKEDARIAEELSAKLESLLNAHSQIIDKLAVNSTIK